MAKQERAVRTRQALIRAAATVFAEGGYRSAALGEVSRLAGVSNGALHFHFENKAALAEAVEAEAVAAVRSLVDAARSECRGLQALVDATHRMMGRLAFDVVLRAGFELSADPCRRGGSTPRRHWQGCVEGMLREAEREGELAAGIAPDGAAAVIVAATVGFGMLGATGPGWLAEGVVTEFWDLVLPRLAGRGAVAVTSRPPAGAWRGPGDVD